MNFLLGLIKNSSTSYPMKIGIFRLINWWALLVIVFSFQNFALLIGSPKTLSSPHFLGNLGDKHHRSYCPLYQKYPDNLKRYGEHQIFLCSNWPLCWCSAGGDSVMLSEQLCCACSSVDAGLMGLRYRVLKEWSLYP